MQNHKMWLAFAEEDLRAARWGAKADPPLIASVVFSTQQCAEKSLKAFLIYNGQPLRRIHDLDSLVDLCKAIDTSFASIKEAAGALNPYLSQTRYPDDCFDFPDVSTMLVCIEHAQSIFDFVSDKIHSVE